MLTIQKMASRLGKLVAGTFGGRARGSAVVQASDIFGNVQLSAMSSFRKYLEAGSGTVWASYRACDVTAKVLIGTKKKLTRGDSPEEVQIKGLSELMASPNPNEAWSELEYKTVFHLKLTGNAFWLKNMANEAGARPEELYCLNPRKVEIQVDPKLGKIGYIYHSDKVAVPLDLNDVIHFRNPHPDRDYYGIGEVEGGKKLFEQFVNRTTAKNNFWKNGASPSGLLVLKAAQNDLEKFEALKRRFHAQYGGPENSGKVAFLAGEWNYQQIGSTAVDSQDQEQSTQAVKDVFALHGVPLSVAGIDRAANFATARVDDLIFRRYTVLPLINLIRDTLQTDLVVGFDPAAKIDWELQGLTDLEQVAMVFVPLLDRGAISPNELRELAGMKKIDNDPLMDARYMTAGLVPMELAGITQDANAQAQADAAMQRSIDRALNPPRNAQA